MRGRKPKPTALKVLAGNPGKRKLPAEPNIAQCEADLPKELKGGRMADAKREWSRLAPMLSRAGVMRESDRSALVVYCQTWQRYLDAEKRFRKEGMFILTRNLTLQVHPAHSILRASFDSLSKMMGEFGLTPASRARITADPATAENPLERLMQNARDR